MEASGTSGMKAGMNGVINLSVLDGWWDEGYQRDNGWAIKPASPALEPERRDREEVRTLYGILQDQLIPLYYNRGSMGYSQEWIAMAKRSMASLLPRFNATRMLNEYVSKFYVPASAQGRRYAERNFDGAKKVAAWKARVRSAWPGVAARRLDTAQAPHPVRRQRSGRSRRQAERTAARRRGRRAAADAGPARAGRQRGPSRVRGQPARSTGRASTVSCSS